MSEQPHVPAGGSTGIEVREQETLAVPATGHLVNLNEPREVGVAIQDIQGLERALAEAKRTLKDALVRYWSDSGLRKTFSIGGGRQAVISGGPKRVYDATAIRDELLAAGMPEERVSQIVIEEISYTVKATEAKAAAAANEEYAAIIARNTTEYDQPYDVGIRRG
jgi:hypothetical protein